MPALVIAFWGSVGITLFGALFVIDRGMADVHAAPISSSCSSPSVFVGIAIYLLALGFRDVDLSVVAPFRYSYLLTSAIGGYLVFRELPDGWTVVGRRPDRGQRHLCAASRGGAPPHAHRQGDHRRVSAGWVGLTPVTYDRSFN